MHAQSTSLGLIAVAAQCSDDALIGNKSTIRPSCDPRTWLHLRRGYISLVAERRRIVMLLCYVSSLHMHTGGILRFRPRGMLCNHTYQSIGMIWLPEYVSKNPIGYCATDGQSYENNPGVNM